VKDYALGIVLGILWIGNWVGYGIVLWLQEPEMDWLKFWEGTFENSTSEFLQLLTFVVLSKFLLFRGSPQSRDGSDEIQAKLDTVFQRLPPVPEPASDSPD
jgi:hypothetical protein